MKKALSFLILLLSLFPAASAYAQSSGKTVRQYYFGFGPAYYSNLNSRSMGTVFSPGILWNVDPTFDLLLAADLGISFKHNDVRVFFPQAKGRFYFDEKGNHSWFAGAGLGVGYTSNHESPGRGKDSVSGLTLGGAFGFMAYRKAKVHVSFEFEHQMMLEESNYGTPLVTSFKLGLHFP